MYLMRGPADNTPTLFGAGPQDGLEAFDSLVDDLQGLSFFNIHVFSCLSSAELGFLEDPRLLVGVALVLLAVPNCCRLCVSSL